MRSIFVILTLAFSLPAFSSQILVQDIETKGNAKKSFADSLTPVLESALSRVDGMSVISESDIKALLKHESNKQLMGCNKDSCMTEIANSLGAELLARTTLSKVGKEVVITISLLDVERAKVVLKSTGRSKKGIDAIDNAVANLFQQRLPESLNGPASLSLRAFEAALLGLESKSFSLDDARQTSRKRVALDIVKTELDVDADPKMSRYLQAISKWNARAKNDALASKSKKVFEQRLKTLGYIQTLKRDYERLSELRKRAREKGTAIQARALRFEPPERPIRLSSDELSTLTRKLKEPRAIVAKALKALKKDDLKTFTTFFPKEAEGIRKFKWNISLRKDKIRDEVLPDFAHLPRMNQSLAGELKTPDRAKVYLRRFKNGKVSGSRYVTLKKIDGQWLVYSW